MSNAELPRSVELIRLAEQNANLEGAIPLAGLDRFRDAVSCVPEGASCVVELDFSMDSERRRIVHGTLKAEAVVQCQRCLTDMTTSLTSEFTLGLVTSDEQAKQLPSQLEPFLMDGFSADLWLLVEDELLLVLPPFPLHERQDCPATAELEALEPETAPAVKQEDRDNPFSVLAGLKTTKH